MTGTELNRGTIPLGLIVGPGVLIGSISAFEDTPPVFTTVMLALPVLAIRLAATDAVSSVALTNTVESGEPFHCTVAPERNPVPFTVSTKAGPFADAELGFRLEMTGMAGPTTSVIEIGTVLPVPPGVSCTVAEYVPVVRLTGFTDIDRVPGTVPDVAERTTHAELAVAVHDDVPPPGLEIDTLWAAGAEMLPGA
jgi:hypothetical protein